MEPEKSEPLCKFSKKCRFCAGPVVCDEAASETCAFALGFKEKEGEGMVCQ
ncbi:MAG: hypothetical protein WC619_04655 [Patescibacteria group bacterium]